MPSCIFELAFNNLIPVKIPNVNGNWDAPEILDVAELAELVQLLLMLTDICYGFQAFFAIGIFLLEKAALQLDHQTLGLLYHLSHPELVIG
jgi:hypothetical protein